MKSRGIWAAPNSFVAGILCGLLRIWVGVAGGVEELEELAAAAMAHNPRIQAARYTIEQAQVRPRERSGFFDPEIIGAAGRSSSVRATPGITAQMTVPEHATVLNISVETPVQPGVYFGLGLSERFFSEAGDGDQELFQTLIGARIRIPLLRDRGFRQYAKGTAQDLALLNQTVSLLLAEMQSVFYELERNYVAVKEAAALQAIAHEAVIRFEVLLREAEKLVELGVTPSYQILPAKMELSLSRSEENEARQAYETSLVNLARVVGVEDGWAVSGDAGSLVERVASVWVEPDSTDEDAFAARGSYQALLHGIAFVNAQVELARDDLRPDLSLEVGSTWQGENRDDLLGDQRTLSEDHLGADAMVVFRRPLGFRSERNRVAGFCVRIAELKEAVRQAELAIRAGMKSSLTEFSMARERLEIVSEAVKAAEDTIAAERQRFRLGEGRSRNVLDAQKDLTGAIRRQAKIAGDVLRAYSDFRFAAGLHVERFDVGKEIRNARGDKTP